MFDSLIIQRLCDSIKVKQEFINNRELLTIIERIALVISDCLKINGKVVICGNGGSASDALHFAGEIVGRFQKERKPWSAIALNADVATMTAIANDYGYDEIFARQAEGHLTTKDVLIGISTSGNSENILRAVQVAEKIGAQTVGFLGKNGGELKAAVQYPLIVPSNITARIQESHITIIHIICEIIEEYMMR